MWIRWTLITAALLAFILVPFAIFDEPLSNWTLARLRGSPDSAFAWIIAALASDVFLPIPSSIVSTLAGTLLGFPKGLAASWLGMMLGSLGGYWFGAKAARGLVERTVGIEELRRVERMRERFGAWGIVVSRPVPVLAEASVIAAGFTRMPFAPFALLNALANLGVSAAYAFTGATAADRDSFLFAFAGSIGLPAIAMAIAKLRSSNR